MVEYASRMLSALEDYSIKASRHGLVAVHSLMLRRSFATNLWNKHDGVLNQILNVGPKTTALLKFHGICSFSDVLATTAEQIEKTGQRASPFGSSLQKAVRTILDGACKLDVSLECVQGASTRRNLVCQISRNDAHIGPDFSHGAPPVAYTLLAYTDRPGGCLLYKREISSKTSITMPAPQVFGKITVIMVASLVGLDGKRLDPRASLASLYTQLVSAPQSEN